MGRPVGRRLHKLSATRVAKLREPGYFGDGGGLWLQVSPSITKSWVFRFARAGREREMGLGALHTVTLAEAREKALACRKQLLDGLDPIETRHASKLTAAAASAQAMTFAQCAEAYIEAHRTGWRNVKHGEQWTSTLTEYAFPVFGSLNVAHVDTGLVMKALEPHWTTKTETATRVRGRIESVLGWAAVRGLRSSDNPARWRGHLDKLLPKPSKVKAIESHAALPYVNMAEFMRTLRAQPGTSARLLEFIILTAARTNEAVGATWQEIDFTAKTWTVPGKRMKAGDMHRVPLSNSAMKLVQQMASSRDGNYIFPGAKQGLPLSNMACLVLLKRMKRTDITTHGFRSTFRDWAAECTNFPREVAEKALAHTLKSATEAAYQRGDLLEKRDKLMQAWSDYCDRDTTSASVTPIRKSRV